MTSSMEATALSHLTAASTAHPDLSSQYEHLSRLYSQKLWHPFTVATLDFLSDPSTARPSHGELFTQVLLPLEHKLNSLQLARMASLVAFGLPRGDTEVLAPLVASDKERFGPAASLYLTSRLGLFLLKCPTDEDPATPSPLEVVSSYIETNRDAVRQLADSEPEAAMVHSAYYEMSMMYRKAVGPPEKYYEEAIQYVAYTNLNDLSSESTYQLAVDVCVSALTGDGVFQFGELIASPLVHALEGTEAQFLLHLLQCGAHGDVIGFQKVAEESANAIAQLPPLHSRADAVKEKMTLLALVTMVFERPSLERTLQFDDIAERVGISMDQVEWLIMRALSLKLIQGTMDQVEQTVDVTWVLPRVLNIQQMEELATRFGQWAVKVSQTRESMLEHTGALLNQ